jgi:hypothetical protein
MDDRQSEIDRYPKELLRMFRVTISPEVTGSQTTFDLILLIVTFASHNAQFVVGGGQTNLVKWVGRSSAIQIQQRATPGGQNSINFKPSFRASNIEHSPGERACSSGTGSKLKDTTRGLVIYQG